jgi:hypothetical protein
MKTDKILNYIFYFSVLVFFIGIYFRDNPQGGWQLQTMPDLKGKQILDITFTDSVSGVYCYEMTADGKQISAKK